MNAFDPSRLITTLQYAFVVASMVAALIVCLWKRNLSPWMYGVALGFMGVISGRTIYILGLVVISMDDFTTRRWVFGLSSILGTLASAVLSLSLVGLFLDVSHQLESRRDLHDDRDPSAGRM